MVRLVVALVLAAASAIAADEDLVRTVAEPTGAYAALVGLLDMPIVYDDLERPGEEAKRARPDRVDVRAQPSASSPVVATIDARGIAVRGVHHCLWSGALPGMAPESAPKLPQCPYWESGYEVPALAVFETRADRWYRVAIDRAGTRFGWLHTDATFHALEALVASDERLTYLSDRWPRTLYERAGGGTRTAVAKRGDTTPYRALRHARVGGELWIEIEVLDEVCGASDPRAIAKGWTPARLPAALVAWYHSRGC